MVEFLRENNEKKGINKGLVIGVIIGLLVIAELREKGTTVFMSSHILSDIEALCDNVAILRNGKLVATGNLQDLLTKSGEAQVYEINVKGVSAQILEKEISNIKGASITAKPNGANILVSSEDDIEKVLQINKKTGGNLVSVQPVKQSLEELFLKTENG